MMDANEMSPKSRLEALNEIVAKTKIRSEELLVRLGKMMAIVTEKSHRKAGEIKEWSKELEEIQARSEELLGGLGETRLESETLNEELANLETRTQELANIVDKNQTMAEELLESLNSKPVPEKEITGTKFSKADPNWQKIKRETTLEL